jgi:cell division protein FtsB
MRNPVRVAGGAARRLLVPEWSAILGDIGVLREDRDRLLSDVRVLRRELAELQRRAAEIHGENEALRARVDAFEEDIDENRRLSARVAEVTDLVTEVVLPLHDREIDVSRIRNEGTEPT